MSAEVLFQKLHRFPSAEEIPPAVVQHLRIHLRLGDAVVMESQDKFQRARQHRTIREYTGVMAWCRKAWRLAERAVMKRRW